MKKFFIIAGEVSGDILAADLMEEMVMLGPDLRFYGIGGEEMSKVRGFKSLFDIRDIAVMGIIEVLSKIFVIRRRMKEIIDYAIRVKPDVLITVDSPDLSFRVVGRLRKLLPNTKFIHYVAPQVWAWKEKRAERVAGLYDALICFFPFEVGYFEKYGLKTFAVGHTSIGRAVGNSERFLRAYGLKKTDIIVSIVPGSRVSMAARLLPIYEEVVVKLSRKFPNIKFVVPVVSTSREFVEKEFADWDVKPVIINGRDDRYDAFAASKLAICISGTAVLELVIMGIPVVVCYQMSGLTYFIAKRLVRIKNVSLPNIILKREWVPEFIQDRCTVKNIYAGAVKILEHGVGRDFDIGVADLRKKIVPKGIKNPSKEAARVVFSLMG